jgi:hypothetical protein
LGSDVKGQIGPGADQQGGLVEGQLVFWMPHHLDPTRQYIHG